MLHTKSNVTGFLVLEKIFKGFYHIWALSSWSFDKNILYKLIIRSLHMKFEFNWANGL